MTTTLTLAYGLVAAIEEGDDERPPPPARAPSSHDDPLDGHAPLACTCVACARWRRARGLPDPVLP